jgi:SMODS-associated and fused to various effectors sensor domain/CHAT domain
MPETEDFEDISLEIRGLGRGRFETRFKAKGQGEAVGLFGLQIDPAKLRPFLTIFNPVPGGSAPDITEIGSQLFDALLQGDVRRLFDRSHSRANDARPDGTPRGIRLRILFDLRDENVRPLAALPWELLHDPLNRIFYGYGSQHLLVRHPEAPQPIEPLTVTPPLRVLLIPSSPKDQPHLDLKAETKALEKALEQDDRTEVSVLRPATIDGLRKLLQKETFHVLHFMGHGHFNSETGQGWLYFEDGSRKSHPVDGTFFSALLQEFPHVRLVVLNACRTAQVSGSPAMAPYGAMGMALSLAGVPAVVAMQYSISDPGAILFSTTFYQALASGEPVDLAVGLARRELYSGRYPAIEWAVPVLFLRSPDGRIFDVPRRETPPAPSARDDAGKPNGGLAREAYAEAPLTLGIRSLEPLGDRPEKTLDLTGHFHGRRIREYALWSSAVLPELSAFLLEATASRKPLLLDFAAHASLAFAAGYLLESKSGLTVSIRQRQLKGGFQDWRSNDGPLPDAPYWKAEGDQDLDSAAKDVAVAVSLTWPVLEDVRHYLDRENLPIRRILPATLAPEPSSSGVKNGEHALALAQALALRIRARTADERHGTLHLFVSGPNAFLFYLGQLAHGLGRIQLYEFDFDKGTPGGYRPSLVLGA